MTEKTSFSPPEWHKIVGIVLALVSSLFVGMSFVFKKKGLLQSNCLGNDPGNSHAYLRNSMWWSGMVLMAVGEVAKYIYKTIYIVSFGAYAFASAILVTPLGALSVVITSVLSSIFLNEKLNFTGKVASAQCLLGSVIIVLNAPQESSVLNADDFFVKALEPLFLTYTALISAIVLFLIFKVAPHYGTKLPIVYISICSLVGSFLVVVTQGFGASIVYTVSNWPHGNQLVRPGFYILMVLVILTIASQINYLNKALGCFSTALVTPIYYVFFTTATMITSAVLVKGFPVKDGTSLVSIVTGFLIIIGGVLLIFQNTQNNVAQPCNSNEFEEKPIEMGGLSLTNQILRTSHEEGVPGMRRASKFRTSEELLISNNKGSNAQLLGSSNSSMEYSSTSSVV